MAEIVEIFGTFVRENMVLVLGIMTLGVLYLIVDREMTLLCPADNSPMRRMDNDSFRCKKCGFVKRV